MLLSTYELGHQPHHLAVPLGFLEAAGYRPRAQDLSLEALDEEAVRAARVVALAVQMHTALRLGLTVLERVRALNPRARVICFGLYAALNAELLRERGADVVLGGEIEGELLRALGETAPAAPLVSLERLRFGVPSRAALPPPSRYARFIAADGGERLAGYVEASRGCKHRCRHCPIPAVYDGRFFVVPREVVLADVAQQVAQGILHLTFGDADFLNGPTHALAVAREVHAAFPSLSFDFTAKIEHLVAHTALLPEFARLGCAFIISAVESLTPEVLRILDKGHTQADVELVLAATRDAGVTLRPTWVPFSPWSDLDEYRRLLAWIAEHELVEAVDAVQLALRLLVPPGSKLLELAEVRAIIGPYDPERLSYGWRHADARVDQLAVEVMALVSAPSRATPAETLAAVARLADQAAGAAPRALAARARPAPRMSESWFCCAEPTSAQLGGVRKTFV